MNKDKNIAKELAELSPILLEMKQSGRQPFRVPEGYFATLKDEIFVQIRTGLADDAGKASFGVPDNYFEELTSTIMDRIEAENSEEAPTKGKVIDLQVNRKRERINVRRWTAMAASVAIFLMMGIAALNMFRPDGGTQWDDSFALSEEETMDYLEENWDTYDTEDLIALVDLSDADVIPAMGSGFEEELEQYLNENIDDLEDYLMNAEI